MTSFVYVSDAYRQAWKTYVENRDNMWEDFDDDFKSELEFILDHHTGILMIC